MLSLNGRHAHTLALHRRKAKCNTPHAHRTGPAQNSLTLAPWTRRETYIQLGNQLYTQHETSAYRSQSIVGQSALLSSCPRPRSRVGSIPPRQPMHGRYIDTSRFSSCTLLTKCSLSRSSRWQHTLTCLELTTHTWRTRRPRKKMRNGDKNKRKKMIYQCCLLTFLDFARFGKKHRTSFFFSKNFSIFLYVVSYTPSVIQ